MKEILFQRMVNIPGFLSIFLGYNFGSLDRGFIEIHHIKPLNLLLTEEYVNPETDLFPVCTNCHRMIHRRSNSILTIEEMKKIING